MVNAPDFGRCRGPSTEARWSAACNCKEYLCVPYPDALSDYIDELTPLAEENVLYDRIDVFDVIENAWDPANLVLKIDNATVPLVDLADDHPAVKRYALMRRLMCSYLTYFRAYHAQLRAALRVSMVAWLSPEMQAIVERLCHKHHCEAANLRKSASWLEQRIIDNDAVAQDAREQSRLRSEANEGYFEKLLATSGDILAASRGTRFQPRHWPDTEGGPLLNSVSGCIGRMLAANDVAAVKTSLQGVFPLVMDDFSCDRIQVLDTIEQVFREKNIDVLPYQCNPVRFVMLTQPTLDRMYIEQYRARYGIMQAYFDYLRAHHAYLPVGLNLDIRTQIRAERERIVAAKRQEAAELEACVRTDLTPHVEALVLARCYGFGEKSVFNCLPDEVYKLVVKTLVNEGKGGNCNAGIDGMTKLEPPSEQ